MLDWKQPRPRARDRPAGGPRGACRVRRRRSGAALTRRCAARRPCPSSSVTTKSPARATSSSWVTTTSVVSNSRWTRRSSSMTARELAESRLPVGSSANRTAGRCASARAIATRWRWPPDISDGARSATAAISSSSNRRRIQRRVGLDALRAQRQLDVLARRQRADEVEALKDEAGVPGAKRRHRRGAQARQLDAGAVHLARRRPIQAREALQQRGLARPRRPEDDVHPPARQPHRHAGQRRRDAVAARDVHRLAGGAGAAFMPPSPRRGWRAAGARRCRRARRSPRPPSARRWPPPSAARRWRGSRGSASWRARRSRSAIGPPMTAATQADSAVRASSAVPSTRGGTPIASSVAISARACSCSALREA